MEGDFSERAEVISMYVFRFPNPVAREDFTTLQERWSDRQQT